MLQARQLGKELYVGVHSDEEITAHKGDPVMDMRERLAAAEACRWVTKVVPDAPYVTDLQFVDKQHCKYVVHGDDITSDSSGQDCYRYVKEAGRMKIVKRTPDISTTDLVGRMLLCTKQHHMRPLNVELDALHRDHSERSRIRAEEMRERIDAYATDASGLHPGVQICFCSSLSDGLSGLSSVSFSFPFLAGQVSSQQSSRIISKKQGQRFIYVDGSFDLFSSGHIEFLRRVVEMEREEARKDGWNETNEINKRIQASGEDYDRAFVIAGIHDDETVNQFKGSNYPIMNIYERGLCVLQCKYINAVIFGAPYDVDKGYLENMPLDGKIEVVYHGKTNFFGSNYDGYSYPKQLNILRVVPEHAFQNVNAAQIYRRIIDNKERFEERQRKKGVKAISEAEARRIEMEAEMASRKG
ncbi:MAG: hypothetical protein Q9162_007435 [Coniocarpon cinnabarinum]